MITATIFAAAYLVVAIGRVPFLRIDRTGAAIVGAVLMVVTGAIDLEAAARSVDVRTLVLLFSMMIIVAHWRLAGGLSALAGFAGTHASRPLPLLVSVVVASGLLSALFVNDTICLVFTPIVLDVVRARGLPPLPYLLALATASNIGSAATVTGNPQNILIGSLSGISFARFVAHIGPVAAAGLAVDVGLLWMMFRRQLSAPAGPIAPARRVRLHRALLVKTLVVSVGVLVAFVAGYDTAIAAAAGAAVLLVTRRIRPRRIYTAVDWDLLMLFVGLFVIVGAGRHAGFDQRLFALLAPLGIGTVAGLSATAAVLSNLVSNVPAVMLVAQVIPKLDQIDRAWLTLAMSSTLAGNLTILGSVANLIVIEAARRRGVIVSFWEYAKFGIPLTAITILLGIVWLSATL